MLIKLFLTLSLVVPKFINEVDIACCLFKVKSPLLKLIELQRFK